MFITDRERELSQFSTYQLGYILREYLNGLADTELEGYTVEEQGVIDKLLQDLILAGMHLPNQDTAAHVALRTVLLQAAEGADDELTMQAILEHKVEQGMSRAEADDGSDVPQSEGERQVVQLAQELAAELARTL